MVDAYTGEIRMFAGTFAPQGWAFCDGSSLPVNAYPALFALLGTIYGGDGVSTFALPDLRSRIPVGFYTNAGPALPNTLTQYTEGQTGGLEQVVLAVANMPPHTHPLYASSANATVPQPANNVTATVPAVSGTTYGKFYAQTSDTGYAAKPMAADSVSSVGVANGSHENRMPTMAINFIMALNGIFPTHG